MIEMGSGYNSLIRYSSVVFFVQVVD